MKRLFVLVSSFCMFLLVALLVLENPVYAEPNLSGEWRLNLAKSNYGMFPAPLSMTRSIVHDGVGLSLSSVQKSGQGDVSSKLRYTTDGKEVINKVMGGESKGSAQWIGDKLVIESAREFQGVTLKQKEIWSVSEDGKLLTVDAHVTLPNGEFDVKQVFERQ